MKYQGVYFNPELGAKHTQAQFKARFQHLWPGLDNDARNKRLNEVHGLLKKMGNANRK